VNQQTDSYRLLIFNKAGTAVLLDRRDGREGYRLPWIEIPKWRRIAKEIIWAIRQLWQLRCVFLFCYLTPDQSEKCMYAVLEAWDQNCTVPAGLEWANVAGLALDGRDARAVDACLAKAIGKDQGGAEPFCRLGWMDTLTHWIEEVVRPLGSELTGDFVQLNGSETFSLVRFKTTKKPVWFKAVGYPNLHEYDVTQGLARLFPQHLPRILGTLPEWHGWLMEDSNGTRLYESTDPRLWSLATEALADLQVSSVSRVEELQAIGCNYRSIEVLASRIDDLVDLVGELMERQPTTPPPILNTTQLRELAMHLKDACDQLADCGVPLALVHGDFTGGNIQVSTERCVFIDWAEAYLSHPFVTFEYLLVHLPKERVNQDLWRKALTETYLRRWQEVIPWGAAQEALRLTPLIALLSHALPSSSDDSREKIEVPEFGKYLRSLSRRMWNEAQQIRRASVA
jgi:hypothetical protein